jgi:hypothetical protein
MVRYLFRNMLSDGPRGAVRSYVRPADLLRWRKRQTDHALGQLDTAGGPSANLRQGES